jgi:hypothetical protein
MRNDITLTDEQIEAAFEAAGALLCADELTFTRDSLQDFATASEAYAECSKPRFEQVGGYSALFLDGAQVRKGDRRIDVIVIDFGTVRAVAK